MKNPCPYPPYYLCIFLSYTSFTHFFFSSYSAAYGETSFSQKRMNELSLILEWNSFCTPPQGYPCLFQAESLFSQEQTMGQSVDGIYTFFMRINLYFPLLYCFL